MSIWGLFESKMGKNERNSEKKRQIVWRIQHFDVPLGINSDFFPRNLNFFVSINEFPRYLSRRGAILGKCAMQGKNMMAQGKWGESAELRAHKWPFSTPKVITLTPKTIIFTPRSDYMQPRNDVGNLNGPRNLQLSAWREPHGTPWRHDTFNRNGRHIHTALTCARTQIIYR